MDWGKSKRDYYYTDYVDKDYPSKLSSKEEKLAYIEQEQALKAQKKLLSTLENVDDSHVHQDEEDENLIEFLEQQNQALSAQPNISKKRKRVTFEKSESEDDDDDEEDEEEDDEDDEDDECEGEGEGEEGEEALEKEEAVKRRPINMAMQKNRGLTPYKKKEYRNPRVKHKIKFKKAMVKRRRNVMEAKAEYHRYSGETTGIKTSTVKSIKLC